jgi:hypothetical protein
MRSPPARFCWPLVCAAALIVLIVGSTNALAAPISVGGFTFDAGEEAFADDASLVSGSGVRFSCAAGGPSASSYAEALTGSDISQCVNVSGGGDGVLEVSFTDNSISNGLGTDLVIFEVSGQHVAVQFGRQVEGLGVVAHEFPSHPAAESGGRVPAFFGKPDRTANEAPTL